MVTLNADEARVLGVLVEKALTTPSQYPLTLNAIVTGANQKSNRHPVTNLGEDDVLDALGGLRAKGFVREVMMTGSRVEKHRHVAREALDVSTSELVILAELMLRGPQTVGELRGRASRMHPIESIEAAAAVLEHLAAREVPLVQRCPPEPGGRAPRYAQLLCPDLHPLDGGAAAPAPGAETAPASTLGALERRLADLESEVAVLSAGVRRLAAALGENV